MTVGSYRSRTVGFVNKMDFEDEGPIPRGRPRPSKEDDPLGVVRASRVFTRDSY